MHGPLVVRSKIYQTIPEPVISNRIHHTVCTPSHSAIKRLMKRRFHARYSQKIMHNIKLQTTDTVHQLKLSKQNSFMVNELRFVVSSAAVVNLKWEFAYFKTSLKHIFGCSTVFRRLGNLLFKIFGKYEVLLPVMLWFRSSQKKYGVPTGQKRLELMLFIPSSIH